MKNAINETTRLAKLSFSPGEFGLSFAKEGSTKQSKETATRMTTLSFSPGEC